MNTYTHARPHTLFAEMLQASSSFSILDPVRPFGRRSQRRRWLSVPSVATSWPLSRSPAASAFALLLTLWM